MAGSAIDGAVRDLVRGEFLYEEGDLPRLVHRRRDGCVGGRRSGLGQADATREAQVIRQSIRGVREKVAHALPDGSTSAIA